MAPVTSVRFIPNVLGIEMIGRSLGLVLYLGRVAEDVAANARTLAPVDTGDYQRGILATSGVEDNNAYGRVNAFDWKSVFIEFGDEKVDTYAPLRRAAEQAGLTLEDPDRVGPI